LTASFAFAQRPCRGETICGDAFTEIREPGLLVALADGLGHGPLANEASEAFCAHVRRNTGQRLEQLMHGATRAIAGTRGAAAAVMRIDEDAGQLSFAGVGNVELQSVSQVPIRPVCTPGIVGRPLRKVVTYRYEIQPGDLLVMYSDGISSRFDLKKFKRFEPQEIVDQLLEEHGKHHDDATVLAVKI